MLDLQILLEETETFNPVLASLDLLSIEGIAFVDAKFAANDFVASGCVAGNVDALNVDPRGLIHLQREVHQPLLGVAVVAGADVCKCIAKIASSLVEVGDGIFNLFRVEPRARLNFRDLKDFRVGEVAKSAVGLYRSEVVPRSFVDDVGNDKVASIRSKFRKRLNDAEIRIALGKIKCPELLLVSCKAIRIISVVRF